MTVAKDVYKYSGAQDVVSCVTHPHLSSCLKAAVTVALVVATAGGGEAEVAAANLAEDATTAAEEVPSFAVRGGTNTLEQFLKQATDERGLLREVSVQSSAGRTVEELSQPISRYGQVGVTTLEKIEALDGKVVPDPLPDDPYHCLMSGISPADACRLFTPTIPNPGR